jgi:hypothetical protein
MQAYHFATLEPDIAKTGTSEFDPGKIAVIKPAVDKLETGKILAGEIQLLKTAPVVGSRGQYPFRLVIPRKYFVRDITVIHTTKLQKSRQSSGLH